MASLFACSLLRLFHFTCSLYPLSVAILYLSHFFTTILTVFHFCFFSRSFLLSRFLPIPPFRFFVYSVFPYYSRPIIHFLFASPFRSFFSCFLSPFHCIRSFSSSFSFHNIHSVLPYSSITVTFPCPRYYHFLFCFRLLFHYIRSLPLTSFSFYFSIH